MKVCVEVLEQVFGFQDEKSLRVGATELSKKESFVARNGGFCIFAAVHFLLIDRNDAPIFFAISGYYNI